MSGLLLRTLLAPACAAVMACGGGGGSDGQAGTDPGSEGADVPEAGPDAAGDAADAPVEATADAIDVAEGTADAPADPSPGDAPAADGAADTAGDEATGDEPAPVDVAPGDAPGDVADLACAAPGSGTGDKCPEGHACLPDLAGDGWVCVPGGTVPVREECGEGAGECVAGAICIPWDETRSYCRSACTFDGKLPCAGEYELCVGDPAAAGVGADLGVCLGDPCTPPAEGCGEDARCTVLVAQVFACVPAGPVPIDGDCEVEECVAGAICKHVDDGGYLCRELCRATEDCTPGQRCVFPFAGIGDWGWCEVPVCDPVLQTGCAEGDACYYEDPEEGSFLCWDEGSLAVGADCSNFNLFCAPGADCFPDPGSDPDYTYHCYAYCDEAHPCAAGTCQDTVLVHGVRLCMP